MLSIYEFELLRMLNIQRTSLPLHRETSRRNGQLLLFNRHIILRNAIYDIPKAITSITTIPKILDA